MTNFKTLEWEVFLMKKYFEELELEVLEFSIKLKLEILIKIKKSPNKH